MKSPSRFQYLIHPYMNVFLLPQRREKGLQVRWQPIEFCTAQGHAMDISSCSIEASLAGYLHTGGRRWCPHVPTKSMMPGLSAAAMEVSWQPFWADARSNGHVAQVDSSVESIGRTCWRFRFLPRNDKRNFDGSSHGILMMMPASSST